MELESPLERAESERPSAWATEELIEEAEATDGTLDEADACIPDPEPSEDANDDNEDEDPAPCEPAFTDPL